MPTMDSNNTERRARLKQRGQEVEMMDDRPISGEEREMISGIDERTDQPNSPAKTALLAGGIGLAALGVATLLRLKGRRRRRRSLLSPRRWIRFVRRVGKPW